ncbi:MAG: flavodoxin family protein [Candidatus Dojkabacteria bacterium]|nr:flavodoxin family protein [Candidatus Dojkabacteria bacterium]MDQ7020967.1 flavodoxin family protein [Candidatus Dojkabacteria bacterium]
MSKCLVLYGTLTMNTEIVAEKLHEAVGELGVFDELELMNMIEITDTSILESYDFIIVGTSTWGEGDYNPDTDEFIYLLEEQNPNLEGKPYSIFGLGEISYDDYCGAAKNLDRMFSDDFKMVKKGELFTIDGYPEYEILELVRTWINTILESNI